MHLLWRTKPWPAETQMQQSLGSWGMSGSTSTLCQGPSCFGPSSALELPSAFSRHYSPWPPRRGSLSPPNRTVRSTRKWRPLVQKRTTCRKKRWTSLPATRKRRRCRIWITNRNKRRWCHPAHIFVLTQWVLSGAYSPHPRPLECCPYFPCSLYFHWKYVLWHRALPSEGTLAFFSQSVPLFHQDAT